MPFFTTGMKWILVGLGNPGGEYTKTRHNAGRAVLEVFRLAHDLPEWAYKKTYDALIAKGEVLGQEVLLVEPETYMNESGRSLVSLVKSAKQATQTVIFHDDIDLPLGTWKLSFDRGSGGQKGVESIMASIKTKAFIRVRIGILPTTPTGKPKKPKGEEAVVKFVLGKWKPEEAEVLEKASKEIVAALDTLLTEGLERTMNKWNK
jgi:PTH1 family peptidyl-tRNA hydrolase